MNNRSFIISILVLILLFSNLCVQGSPKSRSIEDYNFFELRKETIVAGYIYSMGLNPINDDIGIITTNIGEVISSRTFNKISEFEQNTNRHFSWNQTGNLLLDGQYIRKSPSYNILTAIPASSASWSSNGALATKFERKIVIWNTQDFSIQKIYEDVDYTAIAYSPNNDYIAEAYFPYIDIFYTSNHTLYKSIKVEQDETTNIIANIMWSPDSKFLLYNSGEFFIQLVGIENGEVISKLYGFTESIRCFDWSSDGNYIVAGSSDNTVNIYKKDENYEIYTLKLESTPIGIGFMNDSSNIIVGLKAGFIQQWYFSTNLFQAEAGPDIYGAVLQEINLNGLRSQGRIPDGGYEWKIELGSDKSEFRSGGLTSFTFQNPGVYKIILTVIDDSGASSEDITYAHIFDPSQKPVVNITSPKENEKITGRYQFSGTASDDLVVRRVEICLNYGTWIIANGTTEWSYFIDASHYRSGDNTLYARAFDDYQSSDVVQVAFHILENDQPPPGNEPPTIEITYPTNNSEINGTVVITGTANDDTYVSYVMVSTPSSTTASIGTQNWYRVWNSSSMADGEYEIKAKAVDEHGQATTVSIKIKINNTGNSVNNKKPIVLILSPTSGTGASGIVKIVGSAYDDRLVNLVQVRINSSIWHSCNGVRDWNFSFNSSSYPDGNLSIHARAFDGLLFSEEAIIILRFNNSKVNQSNNQTQPPVTPTTTDNSIPVLMLLILLIVLVALIIINRQMNYKHMNSRIRKIPLLIILVLVLIIVIPFIRPSIQTNHTPSSQDPSDNDSNETITNSSNCTHPDFTFKSLRNGEIITNEKELGHVVLIFFSSSWDYDPYAGFAQEIYRHYADAGEQNLTVIFINSNTKVSDAEFNKTMTRYIKSPIPFTIDRSAIRGNFPVYKDGMVWVLLDKKGCLMDTGSVSKEVTYSQIDALLVDT